MLNDTAKVENGRLIINSKDDSIDKPWICTGKDLSVMVNGEKIRDRARVSSDDEIEIIFPITEAKREMIIDISNDRMKATITVNYTPETKYVLEDVPEGKSVTLNCKVVEEKWPPKFTKDDIIAKLKQKGVIYGLKAKEIAKCTMMDKVDKVIVAEGRPVEQPIDDILNIYFEHGISEKLDSDEEGNVDFKAIGNVVSVQAGEVLARRIPGKDGTVGIDIFSKAVQPKKRKTKDMVLNNGCVFKGKDTIVSTIVGHPEVKGSVFQVTNIHEVSRDVDLSTGNINFAGDVVVHNDITEGMSVKVGNKLSVGGNIIRCSTWSEGDTIISGNAISSDIKIKSELSELKDYNDILEASVRIFNELKETVRAIKCSAAFNENITDGNIIKAVIQSKFPKFNLIVKRLVGVMEGHNDDRNELYRMLKIKYVTRNYMLISSADELDRVVKLIEDKQSNINSMQDIKSNAYFNYVQDCKVYSSGSIFIEGKGVYKSDMYAEKTICFKGPGTCELRGGKLFANEEIRAKTVGALSGVTTEIEVGKKGHIYCDVAYFNTKLKVGNLSCILEESCKNLHVYIDKDMELVVEKFKL